MCVERQGDPGPRGVEGPPGFDEAAWWGDCANTWHEEEKQLVYATRMGLRADWTGAHPPTYDIAGASVIDIGGGPVSLLLKCANRGRSVVADPGRYPDWVIARYEHCGIEWWRTNGEDISGYTFDEAWLYNVLQHTNDPGRVVAVAREAAATVRVFEWLDVDPYPGHPQQLYREEMDEWFGGHGYEAQLNEHGCVGHAYYGVFHTP
jgi:hypothetical protein